MASQGWRRLDSSCPRTAFSVSDEAGKNQADCISRASRAQHLTWCTFVVRRVCTRSSAGKGVSRRQSRAAYVCGDRTTRLYTSCVPRLRVRRSFHPSVYIPAVCPVSRGKRLASAPRGTTWPLLDDRHVGDGVAMAMRNEAGESFEHAGQSLLGSPRITAECVSISALSSQFARKTTTSRPALASRRRSRSVWPRPLGDDLRAVCLGAHVAVLRAGGGRGVLAVGLSHAHGGNPSRSYAAAAFMGSSRPREYLST